MLIFGNGRPVSTPWQTVVTLERKRWGAQYYGLWGGLWRHLHTLAGKEVHSALFIYFVAVRNECSFSGLVADGSVHPLVRWAAWLTFVRGQAQHHFTVQSVGPVSQPASQPAHSRGFECFFVKSIFGLEKTYASSS